MGGASWRGSHARYLPQASNPTEIESPVDSHFQAAPKRLHLPSESRGHLSCPHTKAHLFSARNIGTSAAARHSVRLALLRFILAIKPPTIGHDPESVTIVFQLAQFGNPFQAVLQYAFRVFHSRTACVNLPVPASTADKHPEGISHLNFVIRSRTFIPFALAAFWIIGLTGCSSPTKPGVRKTSTTFTCVVLDAGHGGHDSGARSRRGLLEKDLTLDVVRRLAPKLRAAGFRTVLTRNSDVFIPLDRRVDISEKERSAVFLSVHFNDTSRRKVSGMESYYFSEESRRFSQRLVNTLAKVTGAPDRGSRVARFRVLRNNINPAVLVECGYLSNRAESTLLADPRYREKIASALAEAIVKQRGGPLLPKAVSPGDPQTIPQNLSLPAQSLGYSPETNAAESAL